MTADTLPLDYDEWRADWARWQNEHADALHPVRSPFKGKNFLADEILGVWRVNGRVVELSSVTFPNLSERDERGNLKRYDRRGIGLTFQDDAGTVVGSFAELERELGLTA